MQTNKKKNQNKNRGYFLYFDQQYNFIQAQSDLDRKCIGRHPTIFGSVKKMVIITGIPFTIVCLILT